MSKVTDLLLDSLRKAEAGDQADLDENLKSWIRGMLSLPGVIAGARGRKRRWRGCTR